MREIVKEASEDLKITRDEAELIIASLLERPRFKIYHDEKLDGASARLIKMKLRQLKSGVPIEYITKKVQFMDYRLSIVPGVFIPRLETEYFIELITKLVKNEPKKILEIGTGCGAIAISLARIFRQARIIATDISARAIENASLNINNFGLEKQISLSQSDLFNHLSGNFDLIVSNPPYIPSPRLKFLPKSVRDFEPILAIDGGREGISFIKKIIKQGREFVKPNGLMAMEIDEDEVAALKDFLEASEFKYYFFKKDLFGRFRYLFIDKLK